MKKVLRMNDAEIQDMQDQIKKESETDVEDGGLDLPDYTDGVTREPKEGPPPPQDEYEPEDEGEE